MYEEDRIRVLELYNDIFDETGNETAVLQLLVSPTRQAVNLARAYDAKERSAQAGGGTPSYMQVIEQLRADAAALAPALPKPDADQAALFETPAPAPEENVLDDLGISRSDTAVKPDRSFEPPVVIRDYPDEDREPVAVPVSAPVAAPPVTAAQEEQKKPAPEKEVDEFADAVEAFLADFTISEEAMTAEFVAPPRAAAVVRDEDIPWNEPRVDVLTEKREVPEKQAAEDKPPVAAAPAPEKEQPAAPAGQPAPEKEQPALEKEAPAPRKEPQRRVSVADLPNLPNLPEMTERQPIIPLLILFIIAAVPLGLLCAAAILAGALVCLSVAGGFLSVAVIGFGSAFTAFSVFADILLVFGLSLAAAAFSLLFFWLFIWMLIGVLPGLVRGIIALARKLCFKEVTV